MIAFHTKKQFIEHDLFLKKSCFNFQFKYPSLEVSTMFL